MVKRRSSVFRKLLAGMLSLCMLCMMAGTCPVRSLLRSAPLSSLQTDHSIKQADRQSRCPNTEITGMMLGKHAKPAKSGLVHFPVFFAAAASTTMPLPASWTTNVPSQENRGSNAGDRVPLFLKNQSIII